ncbi:hypothetical protein CM49_04271 [Paenibacillus sp. P1XP2]|nr:hypothetical protein CM49_04271 [Paenibacillus sp. P1XP2]
MLTSEAKDAEQESVYENYYNYRELAKKMPPHRILAINRGERENVLKVGLEVSAEPIHNFMARQTVKGPSIVQNLLTAVIEDAYKRLIALRSNGKSARNLRKKGKIKRSPSSPATCAACCCSRRSKEDACSA